MNSTASHPSEQARQAALKDLRHAAGQLAGTGGKDHVCGDRANSPQAAPTYLERLDIILEDGPARRTTETGGGKAGSRPPLYLPAMELRRAIRDHSNEQAIRITGIKRYAYAAADAVLEWAAAAEHDEQEATDAAKKIRIWINAIETMAEPPVTQEVKAACGACHTAAKITITPDGERRKTYPLVLTVREGGLSTVTCTECGATLPPEKIPELGAWVRGVSLTQVQSDIAALNAPAPITKPRPDQDAVLRELRDYVKATGHMPPIGAGTEDERRLSEWVKNRMKHTPSSEKALIIRTAVEAILSHYPKASEAPRLQVVTEESPAMTQPITTQAAA